MNEQRSLKVYAPLSGKEIKFNNGGTLLKLSGKAEKLIDFIRANTNEKGYVNLKVERRREVDEWGNTHSVQLDTWQPRSETSRQDSYRPQRNGSNDSDSVPF